MHAPTLARHPSEALENEGTHRLFPPSLEQTDGVGPTVDLGRNPAALMVATVGINHVIENERLRVSIWGSPDGTDWEEEPLVSFPPKSYCGIYSTFLTLAKHPRVRYLRVKWSMNRSDKSSGAPLFGFYVSVQECDSPALISW